MMPVFLLALVQGKAPVRQWLVYAHSPPAARRQVRITIPDHRVVAVDVAVGGSFYGVGEKDASVRPIR
jgi:proline racemase